MDSDSSDNEGASFRQPLKRRSDPDNWKKTVAKQKKNSGEAYTSLTSGKQVEARKIGPPCSCKNKCCEKLGSDAIEKLFSEYYKLDYNGQSHYIHKHISSIPVKRVRVKDKESRRKFTYEYSVTVKGKCVSVCSTAFLSVHGINKGRVHTVLDKVASQGSGILGDDMRGRKEPHNKTSAEATEFIKNFIDELPTCTSHYSRAKSPFRRYLPPGSTFEGCYKAYLDRIEERHMARIKVSKWVFEKLLSVYNIGIEPPRSDTCNYCDAANIKMKNLQKGKDDDEITRLKTQKVLHEANAKASHSLLKAFSKDDNPNIAVITFDLQQTLPTPRLSSSAQYYKRKMWTYNFGIHDCKVKQAHFYVWNETQGGRGSREVCSCIEHYILNYISLNVKKLVIFSDNCGGQNKNMNVVLTYLRLIHMGRFDSIEHYFMEPGHSYLPNDRDFGNFEVFLKGKEVYSTSHYVDLMKACRPKNPVTVVEMTHENFFDFKVLQNHSTKASQSQSGFKAAKMFIVSKEDKTGIEVRATFGDDVTPSKFMKVQKGRAKEYNQESFDLSAVQLPLLYPNDIKLDGDKVSDLKDLIVFIPASYSAFFERIFAAHEGISRKKRGKKGGNAAQVIVQEVGEDHPGEEDPNDDFLDY